MPKAIISNELVEAAVDIMLKGDTSYCDCRRSPFDGHSYYPPCETVKETRVKMRSVLEALAPKILMHDHKEFHSNG